MTYNAHDHIDPRQPEDGDWWRDVVTSEERMSALRPPPPSGGFWRGLIWGLLISALMWGAFICMLS